MSADRFRPRSTVLLIDHSALDLEFARIAFEDGGHPPDDLHTYGDGTLAWQALSAGEGALEASALRLILLELELPGLSGFDLLRRIRQDDRLALVPALVLSGSDEDHDVEQAYRCGANAYLTKPLDFSGYRAMVAALQAFWIGLNRLAPTPPHAPHLNGSRP